MKKIIVLFMLLITLTGCGEMTPKSTVENYLKKYRNLDSEVLVDLEELVAMEDLTEEQKDKYRDILKKQYKDIKYEIVEEEYDEDKSYVTVKISVYDLYKAENDASLYLSQNETEFYNDQNEYDNDLFIDYKLKKMQNMNDLIEHTVVFTVIKEDDKYVVEQPTDDMLEKIHGIYNYESY